MFIFFFTAHLIVCERGFTVGRSEDTNFVPQCISIFCCLFLKSWSVIFFCRTLELLFLVNII